MKTYDTVLEALNGLKQRGFTHDFNLNQNCLICGAAGLQLQPHEFEILETYRFEGMSDPDENAIVYAIEAANHKMKGVLVNAYGAYADPLSDALAAKLFPSR